MIAEELFSSWTHLALAVVSAVSMLVGIVVYVRIAGLRSFSKMSAFDFAVTVAFGSILGAVALSGSPLVEGLVAAASLLAFQTLIGFGRSRFGLDRVVDNTPLLLVVQGEMLTGNLRRARITEQDIHAKLRQANVATLCDVQAVVLETTGDLSVVHGHRSLDPDLFADIAGADALTG